MTANTDSTAAHAATNATHAATKAAAQMASAAAASISDGSQDLSQQVQAQATQHHDFNRSLVQDFSRYTEWQSRAACNALEENLAFLATFTGVGDPGTQLSAWVLLMQSRQERAAQAWQHGIELATSLQQATLHWMTERAQALAESSPMATALATSLRQGLPHNPAHAQARFTRGRPHHTGPERRLTSVMIAFPDRRAQEGTTTQGRHATAAARH
ncbi:MAG: phasin family protein [Leptothrix sp. (in: b-proteobacteria)]